MRTRSIGNPTVGRTEVGAIGLGLMTFDQSGTQPREQLAATVRAALDAGVTLFDTADAYGPGDEKGADSQGENERLIVSLLDELGVRDQVLLATKGGHVRTAGGGWDTDSTAAHLRQAVDDSLSRLGVEQIALWQHHRPDPDVDDADVIGTLKEIADSGKVRMVGLSNADPDQIRAAHAVLGDHLVSVQNQFSPKFRSSKPEIDVCDELRPGVPAVEPARRAGRRQGAGRPAPGVREDRRGPRRQRPAGGARLGARPVARRHPDPRRQAPAVDHRLGRRRRPRPHRRRGRGARRRLTRSENRRTEATMTQTGLADLDLDRVEQELYADGITAMRGAHPPELIERLHEECLRLYEEASSYPGGRVRRGPQRWYYAVHPERLSMVVDLLSHPWLVQTCRHVLGDDYRIREVAFDVSFPGSKHQPWHRDFRRPVGMTTGEDGRPRLTALAFNLPTVDVREELGPLEVVHGTQWDEIPTDDGMFPAKGEGQERYEADDRRALKRPKRGDMSARTPLMLHRGTPNVSHAEERPVMVITVYAADAEEVLDRAHRARRDAGLPRQPAAGGARPPRLRGRRPPRADRQHARHRGPQHGWGRRRGRGARRRRTDRPGGLTSRPSPASATDPRSGRGGRVEGRCCRDDTAFPASAEGVGFEPTRRGLPA